MERLEALLGTMKIKRLFLLFQALVRIEDKLDTHTLALVVLLTRQGEQADAELIGELRNSLSRTPRAEPNPVAG